MTITKKIAAVSLAALTMGAVFSASQAQARGWVSASASAPSSARQQPPATPPPMW